MGEEDTFIPAREGAEKLNSETMRFRPAETMSSKRYIDRPSGLKCLPGDGRSYWQSAIAFAFLYSAPRLERLLFKSSFDNRLFI